VSWWPLRPHTRCRTRCDIETNSTRRRANVPHQRHASTGGGVSLRRRMARDTNTRGCSLVGLGAKAHFALSGRGVPSARLLTGAGPSLSTADRQISLSGASRGWPIGPTDASYQRHPTRADPPTSSRAPGHFQPGSVPVAGALRLVPRRSCSRRSDRGGMTRCGLAMQTPRVAAFSMIGWVEADSVRW
jgi:hypothetical protein